MEREGLGAYIKRLIFKSGMIGKIIAVNTAVFLFFLIIQLIERLYLVDGLTNDVAGYFVAPATPVEMLYKPWTLITHFFTHLGFRHFFFNMLVFYFTARIFVSFFGERRLLSTYIAGGIFAYFFHTAAYYVFPLLIAQGPPAIVGASASVMAVFIAAAVYKPAMRVMFFGIIPVPLALLAGLYIVSDLFGVGTADGTAHFAHLGGALFGGLSVINAHSPRNIMNRIDRFIFRLKLGNFSFKRKRKPKMKVYGNRNKNVKEMTDDEYNASKKMQEERINAILDKISKRGYEGLTKEEKDILFNESRRK